MTASCIKLPLKAISLMNVAELNKGCGGLYILEKKGQILNCSKTK
jgi:hypothetical protein